MRGFKNYLAGLSTLHELEDVEQARATFRQSMATLAELSREPHAVPLEGVNPEQLLWGVRYVLRERFLDDLSFLSPSAAAAALYGLASALPLGPERRELGRRVLRRLHEGDATTFSALAGSVALGSTRAFEGAAMRARVGLSLVLPIGTGASADPLALVLVSRRELARRWLLEPAVGALPDRRMAARLLERAAREAARRAVQGDDASLSLFDSHDVRTAWTHLMADREPLVWRHVATARGLLSTVVPRLYEEIERDLAAVRSFSRNRRGTASLAARIALAPGESLDRACAVLAGPMLARDPGIASAMVYGLPRAAEVEPEAAEQLLRQAVEHGGALAAEALLDLRREWFGTDFGSKASEIARVFLRKRYGTSAGDDGQAALIDLLCEELGEQGAERSATLPDAVFSALMAFASQGAREAYELAQTALQMATERVDRLEATDESEGPRARQEVFRVLHELDVGLCESSALLDLLCLGAQGGNTARVTAPLNALVVRLTRLLMASEAPAHRGGEKVPHLTLRMRRLRTLLHLLDTDPETFGGDAEELRGERLHNVRLLLSRVERDASSAMDRIVHAALARAADGLVRDETLELSDVLLGAACHVPTYEGFAALSEGSMLPEPKQCFKALALLGEALHAGATDAHEDRRVLVSALEHVARTIPPASAARTEGLRVCLRRVSRALARIVEARSLRELVQATRVFEQLEAAVDQLAELTSGVRRRFGAAGADGPPTSGHGVSTLAHAIERAADDDDRVSLELTLETLADSLRVELPPPFSMVMMRVMRPLLKQPCDAPQGAPVERRAVEPPLPAWLPPGRTLGGFYVLRALGAGAGGSVFVVKRVEERADPHAPELALKVPEYDGSAARSLSEGEFLRMFRQEAGAMLAVPSHENLASFVTFDAGARPKPILVMELVDGVTLERSLIKRDLSMERAFEVLDGVLCGLSAMHSVGVGHLDVKPSNIIMRSAASGGFQPVLVDFGLAGRHVRPGCATAAYGAPEIWGLVPNGAIASPLSVDVYAFGCVAYEVLCGGALFDAPHEMATIAMHVSHDGVPGPVEAMARDPRMRSIAEWLSGCLRQDARNRASVAQLRKGLSELRAGLLRLSWPLSPQTPSEMRGASVAS